MFAYLAQLSGCLLRRPVHRSSRPSIRPRPQPLLPNRLPPLRTGMVVLALQLRAAGTCGPYSMTPRVSCPAARPTSTLLHSLLRPTHLEWSHGFARQAKPPCTLWSRGQALEAKEGELRAMQARYLRRDQEVRIKECTLEYPWSTVRLRCRDRGASNARTRVPTGAVRLVPMRAVRGLVGLGFRV